MSVVVEFSVRDLVHEDLPSCTWAGSGTHLAHVADALERRHRGEVDYLAICPPSNLPVAIGGVDYAPSPEAGSLWQFSVHPALRSCGIGTALVRAAEKRILERGLYWAELGVEESNPRARALYERLGYVAYDRRPEAWDAEAPDGSVIRYETICTLMRRRLE
ncbi:GNAT family N-acetyltransferase [Spirillospora sp. NPDC029432]|uniref:GNAT family N-acetyltransferase n=1 Tax=Spirillospora sp. NPDC029432 TaxID=3154599 RepID=UPI003454E394